MAYCLGITAVDPVRNGLLFERFLSEARVDGQTEAPDIDVDFEHDRREEVLDYVYGKYARPSAVIGVHPALQRATALQDAMRALGYPAELAFRLSKRLHHDGRRRRPRSFTRMAPGRGSISTTPRAQALLAIMRACDGLPRLRSTHPAASCSRREPLGDYAPIEWTTMGRSIIQFDKDDLDLVGIPKFDFLGLGGLAVVRRAFDAIERAPARGRRCTSSRTTITPTYELIGRGETIGTFQIESRAQIASILHTSRNISTTSRCRWR